MLKKIKQWIRKKTQKKEIKENIKKTNFDERYAIQSERREKILKEIKKALKIIKTKKGEEKEEAKRNALEYLKTTLNDKDVFLRIEVLKKIYELEGIEAFESAKKVLMTATDNNELFNAAKILGEIGNKTKNNKIIEEIFNALQSRMIELLNNNLKTKATFLSLGVDESKNELFGETLRKMYQKAVSKKI